MKRLPDGTIVDAYDLFHRPVDTDPWVYVRTLWDVPKVDGVPQIQLSDQDPDDGTYVVFPSFGPENVVLPRSSPGSTVQRQTKQKEGHRA